MGDMHLISYNIGLNYDFIEKLGMDLNKVLKSHTDREIKAQSGSSVCISAAVTSYARITMNKHKLDILAKGGNIYYSYTDSIVTDTSLPKELVSKTDLGKFKLEYKVKKGIFISKKTYCLVLADGVMIKKAKGVKADLLTYNDYVSLLNNTNVFALKNSSNKDYAKGSVLIKEEQVILRSDRYTKRDKLLDNDK